MTFLEAAIAILQREGKPLHFKKLTEIALQDNLLTVVGRTPEVTMQQRLNDALKKEDSQQLLTREKPGVFGLRYYARRGDGAAAPGEAVSAAVEPAVAAKVEPVVATKAEPAVAAKAPVVAAAKAEPAAQEKREGGGAPEAVREGEERRRRRRGGRGRRRREEGTPGSSPAEGSSEGPDDDATDDAVPPAAGAADAAAATVVTAPVATARPPAPSSRPARHRGPLHANEQDDDGPAIRNVPPLPGSPERRSFAEAAAVVAAAHRRRGASEGATAETAVVAAPVVAPMPPAAAPDPVQPTVARAVEPSRAALDPDPQGSESDAEQAAAQAELDEFEHPSGPLIAPSFGTEELVRGEDHREPIDKPNSFGRGRERERFRDRKAGRQGGPRPDQRPPQRGAERKEPRAEQRPEPRGEHRPARGEPRRDARPEEPRRDARAEEPRRDARAEEPRRDARAEEPRRDARPEAAAPATAAPRPPQEARPGAELGPVEAVIEILRGVDGRPIHVRQIVEMAMKRRLLRGDLNDLMRLVRGALIVDSREREAAGLRPRVRAAGGSNYQLADRRLEPELAQQERELGERVQKIGEATRIALLRRLGKLPSHAFETLMRLLAARLGISDVELVKRGDGVAYFGGERPGSGAAALGRRRRVLIGIRSGDAELSRRAVGELRAGLEARSYDEGLLLAAGRIGDEALAELGATGGAVSVHDAEELASLCVRYGVGSMRRAVPVDVLDVDLLGDLAEA